MNAFFLLSAELAASVGLSVAVLFVLSRPLVNVLRLLCPNDQAAVFWLSYTRIMLTMTPLMFVLIASMFSQSSDLFDMARLALVAALAGLLLGLWIIGRRLNRFSAAGEAPFAAKNKYPETGTDSFFNTEPPQAITRSSLKAAS
jgi:hypothetical protein